MCLFLRVIFNVKFFSSQSNHQIYIVVQFTHLFADYGFYWCCCCFRFRTSNSRTQPFANYGNEINGELQNNKFYSSNPHYERVRERDTPSIVCVCAFQFESMTFDGITQWFSLFLSTFLFCSFWWFSSEKKPQNNNYGQLCEAKKKNVEEVNKIHKIICTHNGTVEVKTTIENGIVAVGFTYSFIYLFFERKPEKIHKLKSVSRKWICSGVMIVVMDAIVGKSLCCAIVCVLLWLV